MHVTIEKPFDWKKSGVYSWKAGFPLGPPPRPTREPPALPAPAAEDSAAKPAAPGGKQATS